MLWSNFVCNVQALGFGGDRVTAFFCYFSIEFTGGSVNPATSFGPAVIGTDNNRWDYHYIHWIGPNLAGIISAVVYRLFFATKAWIPVFRQAMDDDDDDSDDVVTSIN